MQHSNFRFEISDCGRRRPGVTIVEVLFSVLIAAVGLFGAIAVFPVASGRARQARVNDSVANAGRSAVHTFDALGMRRYDRWYTWNIGTGQFVLVTLTSSSPQSFCIDSRFVANNTGTTGTYWANAQYFPYTPFDTTTFGTTGAQMTRVAFFPGKLDPGGATNKDQFDRTNSTARDKLLADSLFQLEDDFVYLRPGLDDVSQLNIPGVKNDRSLPAMQRFDYNGTTAVKRQSLGHLSWMATLVPRVDLSTGLASDDYSLSVVTFYDRPTDLQLSTFASGGNENLLERAVSIYATSGDGGGEVVLYCPSASINAATAAARLKIRQNHWVLLSGTVTTGISPPTTVSRFQWYRVAQCDNEVEFASGGGLPDRYQVYVSLIGPDWDTSVFNRAVIVEGVVAVHEKTIRLDKSE
jgi:hypothetical protein